MKSAVVGALAAMGLVVGLMPAQSKAAVTYYNPNGTAANWGVNNSPGTSWEGNVWSTGNSSSATAAVGAWNNVDAGFAVTTPTAFTVNVGATETDAGVFNSSTGETITIAQAASTTGNLSLVTGQQGFSVATNSSVIITAPITGAGGVVNQGAGSLFLYGNNTYAGGTAFGTSSGVNYNNNNSFGTGSISFFSGTFGILADPDATAPITIANPFTGVASDTLLVTGAQPTTFTGQFTMTGTSSLSIGNTPFPNATETISGNIVGTGANIIKSGVGVLIVSGTANTYSGTTTVTGGTLKLGAANTIASTTKIIMNGGTLDPDDLGQSMTTTTMGMTASSTLTYAAGNVEVDFANSTAQTWTGTLNLVDWSNGNNLLRFGTSTSGLTLAQLADIEINSNASTKGEAFLDTNGYLVVPEPTTVAMMLLGAPLLAARRRR